MFLPISLNISNKKILLIGGGKVALEKISSLKRFTDNITIISEEIDAEIRNLKYTFIIKSYEKSDLIGFSIVYACTNNHIANSQIRNDCEDMGILVNLVDNSMLSDFISPAIYKRNEMTIAVSSNGKDVKKSILWRNKIRVFIDNSLNSVV